VKSFLDRPELQASASHVQAVQRTLDRLHEVREQSWAQLLAEVSRLYRAGELDVEDLLVLAAEMKQSYGPGYTKAWDRSAPVAALKIRHKVDEARRNRPNAAHGSWSGTLPILDQAAPPPGQSVVYVLFDECNNPVYVGSTETFRDRINDHRKEKGGLASWTAFPCRDREHAFDLEVSLLRQYKPRLNKKVGR